MLLCVILLSIVGVASSMLCFINRWVDEVESSVDAEAERLNKLCNPASLYEWK